MDQPYAFERQQLERHERDLNDAVECLKAWSKERLQELEQSAGIESSYSVLNSFVMELAHDATVPEAVRRRAQRALEQAK